MDKNVNDIELEANDLRIKNGDFVLSDSDQQHIEDILLMAKGQLRHSPITGFGINKYLNSPGTVNNIAAFKRKLKAQLEYDGYSEITANVSNGIANIIVDAKRL